MAIGGGSDRLMSDINVTPFVDVMLVLLIIFMVTAPMMVQGVDVALPEVTAKPMVTEKENLTVTIDREANVYINDFQVRMDFLKEKLEKILAGKTDREVFFRADKDVAYGVVVSVMAEIKAAGVDRLGMVTDPFDDPTSGKRSGKKG
ncbi:protein TolR [Desulfosarcina alkanivorans]|jgi:biopolymer transport protein TolR|uniref:Protein TolR n=1 Tax=Desulfosarcina alkanivorans TaxID=571177 RepID=A0A5K7YSW6_9BACT|nr:protein TolR [Desulfosarcina alkanivorans]BBO72426.1 protein TolR [Desulfosarcina alkanivorans]